MQGNRSVDIPSVSLGNSLSTHLACRLEEVTLFVRLDGEHPSFGHIIFRLDFPQVDEIKKPRCQPSICTPNVLLLQTVCSILVLLGLRLPFVHGISFHLLFLLPFSRLSYIVPTRL